MDNAGYVALGRQTALARRLDMIAQNVANMSTNGFRAARDHVASVSRPLEVKGGAVAFAADVGRFDDARSGPLTQTGAPLDLAIEGTAFFQVETPDGPALTRNGAFSLSPEGLLVNADGHAVLDAGGAPIILPSDAAIAIAGDGTISADGLAIGQVGLFTVPPQSLIREAGVLFRSDAAPEPATDSRIAQGFLEGANVDPVQEIVRLIETQRAYEQAQNLIEAEDKRIRRVTDTLGRAG